MFLILAFFALSVRAQTADLAVTGARIYTSHPNLPVASVLVVKDGRILAISDDVSKVSKYVESAARKIDGRGLTIVPGLIDSHVHMAGLGESLEIIDLRQAKSAADAAEAVRRAARDRKPGEWIRGRSWDQTAWPGREFPDAATLDRAAPANPVYLARVDGHAAWVNTRALELADINVATPDPAGGKILRDSRGAATGVLIDRAQGLVGRKLPPPTAEQMRERIARAAKECARLGLTSVHDAGVGAAHIAAYRELIREGRLPVRVYAMIGGDGELWREYLKRGPEIGERLTVRSIKLVADGALGSRGAALHDPYSDDPANKGLLITSAEVVERVAREAVSKGFQVNTHAIGDRANAEVLRAYGAALGGENDRRFRIEHAQIVALEDIPLFAKYSIIASMQATHATSDMRWAEARVGTKRILGAYAWQPFLAAGVPIANGSDFPVENPNPLWGFYSSVTRQDHAGSPEGGWQPDQRMSREEALKSWTVSGAFAAFEESDKGVLAVGKLADFVMLSRDVMRIPAKEILQTRVVRTVVGGKVVYGD